MANGNHIANPAPLGLAGFGLTTVILSLINAEMLTAEAMGVVLSLAVAYGGGAQFLAGMWEFQKGNTFAATAFSSYGAFWLSFFFIQKFFESALVGVAVYLLLWGVITFYLWIGTFYLNKALFYIFLFLWITFVLLALGDFGITSLGIAGGWVGLLTGLIALYTSAAEVINFAAGREVLPVGEPFKQPD
ncbi:MAG TPA: acetate uptake transporter [Bacillota bacterium]|nr:acetate uptake transporter [Bacillota bacterium]